jgi:N-acetylglucosaminyldiphosphoundecaprenol N-acetyl-beta-D-mannosaminyltransferase
MSCPSIIPQTASRSESTRRDAFLTPYFSESARRTLDFSLAFLSLLLLTPLWLPWLVRWAIDRTAPKPSIKLGRHFVPYWEYTFPDGRRFNRFLVLWNLLAGHVSVVGPRPASPDEFNLADPVTRRRFAVKPGLVSPWWIRQRANIAYGREIDADAAYVNSRSLVRDAAILLRALVAACYGRSRPSADRIALFGIEIDNLTMDHAIAEIVAATDGNGPPRQISFVNADCVNLAHRNARYREALAGSTRVFADGIGMKIAGRILGSEIRENLCGTDVFPRLCAALAEANKSIYLLGARPGVAQAACEWISRTHPAVRIAGFQDGYYDSAHEPAIVAAIAKSRPDVLLVAFGAPKQELWIAQHLAASGARVALGVGGLFDYYSGRIPRAPLWVREIGMEWVWRLIQEPGRLWKRYLAGNIVFLTRTFVLRLEQTVVPLLACRQ